MARELFVDTSAWFVLAFDAAESRPVQDALRDRVARKVRVVTTNLIVAETHALLLRRANRRAALVFVSEAIRPPTIVVSSSAEMEAVAVRDWLERYEDQDFSLTDAVSFAVMTERGIREALTLDHHFASAGFGMVPGGRATS